MATVPQERLNNSESKNDQQAEDRQKFEDQMRARGYVEQIKQLLIRGAAGFIVLPPGMAERVFTNLQKMSFDLVDLRAGVLIESGDPFAASRMPLVVIGLDNYLATQNIQDPEVVKIIESVLGHLTTRRRTSSQAKQGMVVILEPSSAEKLSPYANLADKLSSFKEGSEFMRNFPNYEIPQELK